VSPKVERVTETIAPHVPPKNDRVVDALLLAMHATTFFYLLNYQIIL
jgi:hypothetical protein